MNFPDLPDDQTVAIDTETTGLDWRKDHTVGLVLTWGDKPDETAYHPIRHAGSGNLDAENTLAYYRGLLKSPRRRAIMHNAAFDLDFLANDDVKVAGPIEDTSINATLLDENAKRFSLEACCSRMGVQEKKGDALYAHLASLFGGEPERSQMANFHKLEADDPYAHMYAGGDGTSTYQLWGAQQEQLNHQNLRRVWGVESNLINVLHRCKRRGVKVDEERLQAVRQKVTQYRDEAQAVIGEINVRSSPQIRKYLESLGSDIPVWPTTAKGNPSFPEKYLDSFPQGQAIVRVRKFSNLLASFINPLEEEHIWNGRVHASFQQTASDDYGTVSGRLSSYRPNLQQVPKRNKELGMLFRSIFVPDEGMIWGDDDWSQMEYRLFAHYAGIQQLIDGYNQGDTDIHSYVAELTGLERDLAKRVNLALLYGMGPKTMADNLGISLNKAKSIRNTYYDRIPEAQTFHKRAEHIAATRGYVFSLLGRRRRFPDRRFAYKAISGICQSSNADAVKAKMVELHSYFEENGGNLFFTTHDAFSYQVPKDKPDAFSNVKNILEDFGPNSSIPLSVKIQIDHGQGSNWAEATYNA